MAEPIFGCHLLCLADHSRLASHPAKRLKVLNMAEINYVAIVVATVAAFAGSFLWYMVFGQELAKVSPAFAAQQPAAWKMLASFNEGVKQC